MTDNFTTFSETFVVSAGHVIQILIMDNSPLLWKICVNLIASNQRVEEDCMKSSFELIKFLVFAARLYNGSLIMYLELGCTLSV